MLQVQAAASEREIAPWKAVGSERGAPLDSAHTPPRVFCHAGARFWPRLLAARIKLAGRATQHPRSASYGVVRRALTRALPVIRAMYHALPYMRSPPSGETAAATNLSVRARHTTLGRQSWHAHTSDNCPPKVGSWVRVQAWARKVGSRFPGRARAQT